MEQKSRLKALKERLSELDSERLNILNEMELYFNNNKTRRNRRREIVMDAIKLLQSKGGEPITILELDHFRNKMGKTIKARRVTKYYSAVLGSELARSNSALKREKYGFYSLSENGARIQFNPPSNTRL